MAKKIIILNGSPRLNGNTMALCKAFEEGAKEAGNEVHRFDLQTMDIKGCLGCFKGGKDKSSPCIQKDDMDKIYPVYEECDVVVLASPMYYWTVSGQLKTAFDRLFAVAECNPDYLNPVKECVLIMPAEDTSAENFQAIENYYNTILNVLHWKDRGRLLVGGFLEAGKIKGSPLIETAKKLGASM